jgi:hypothetical protein
LKVEAVAQELKLTVMRGREQRDKLLLEVDRLKQVSNCSININFTRHNSICELNQR